MRKGMGIAIRISRGSAVNGQGYSIAGGQGYSNSSLLLGIPILVLSQGTAA
jgi:hypothetical protein